MWFPVVKKYLITAESDFDVFIAAQAEAKGNELDETAVIREFRITAVNAFEVVLAA